MGIYLKSEQSTLNSTLKFSRIDESTLKIPVGFWVSFFLIVLATGLIAYSRRQFAFVIQVDQMSQLHYMLIDACGALISAITLSLVASLSYKNPIWKHNLSRTIMFYLILVMTHCLLFVSGSAGLRHLLFHLLDLEIISPMGWGTVFRAELPAQLFMLTLTISTMHGLLFFQRSNAEQRRYLSIQQQLIKERLRSLQGQLNPHFLFNTLNTVSALMYDKPEAADRIIERLSDLLRASFKLNSIVEVPLYKELHLLNAYTSIMQDRFPDKFDVYMSCDSSLEQMLIPPLLLQPLVENCFKHGRLDTLGRYGERGVIELSIEELNREMVITILDNGDSKSSDPSSTVTSVKPKEVIESNGLGLQVTHRRLKLLYRDQYSLVSGERTDQRGYRVQLTLPLRESSEATHFSPSPTPMSSYKSSRSS